jgi:hypothetical protein
MATENPFQYGPHVQVAALCERALVENDGVLSLIRLVDVINHTERSANPPSEMPPIRYPLTLVITLKSGRARGRQEVTITPELPSGETLSSNTLTVQLEGEGRGANITAPLDIPYSLEGLYWFNIRLGDHILTRIPLDVRYSRITTGQATTNPQNE